MLEIKTSYQNGILNIELHGAFDSLTSPDFKQWLTDKSNTGYAFFALNCKGLEYISSRGIGMLVELNNILNERQTRLMLYQVSNEVLNLLEFLKLSDSLPIAETYMQVEKTFGENPQKIKAAVVNIQDRNEPEKVSGLENTSEKNESSDDPVEQIPHSIDQTENQAVHEHKLSVTEKEHEYIDLNSEDWTKHGNDVSKINIIFCPNCGEKLKVSKKGLYLCPECRNKFNYPFQ